MPSVADVIMFLDVLPRYVPGSSSLQYISLGLAIQSVSPQ